MKWILIAIFATGCYQGIESIEEPIEIESVSTDNAFDQQAWENSVMLPDGEGESGVVFTTSSTPTEYREAVAACVSPWRLPTIEELSKYVVLSDGPCNWDPKVFHNGCGAYWAQTEIEAPAGFVAAAYLDFENARAYEGVYQEHEQPVRRVRCVREK